MRLNKYTARFLQAPRGPLVALLVLLALAYVAFRMPHASSIRDFERDYEQANSAQREVVAENYLKLFSPPMLLQAIEKKNEPKLCHVQAHPIGRAIYKKSGNFAESIRQCGSACTYGCFHGALMEMFATDSDTLGGVIEDASPDALVTRVKQIAPDLCDRPEVASAVPYRFCTHGIGHMFAFMYRGDLDAAIHGCDVLKTRLAVNACVNGVFMEHMFDPEFMQDAETKTEAPCDRYPQYAEQCLHYKAYGWIRVWGSTESALAACDTLGTDSLICMRTVGEATSSPLLRSTKEGFQAMCGSLSGEKFKACVIGTMLKLVDVNNGDDSDRLCDAVAAEYRDACLQVIHGYFARRAEDMERAN